MMWRANDGGRRPRVPLPARSGALSRFDSPISNYVISRTTIISVRCGNSIAREPTLSWCPKIQTLAGENDVVDGTAIGPAAVSNLVQMFRDEQIALE